MATYTDEFSSGGATLKLIVTRESYSTKDNTSYLKCVLKITKDKDYSSYNTVDASISMTINGSKLYSSTSFDIRDLSIGSTKTLATKYITVSHNSDGTKSVSCKASFTSGVALGSASISATYTCETIPRKSTLTVSSGTLGTSQKLTITEQASAFYHKLTYSCGSKSGYILGSKEKPVSTLSTSWAPPLSLAKENTTGKSVSITFTLYTYTSSSGSLIGSNTYTKSFTVPSSVKPGVPSISLEDLNGYYSTYGYVQNKSKVKVTTSASTSNCQGATIKSYTIYLNGNKCSSSTFTLSSSGKNTIKVVATDTRGATNSNSIEIDVAKYSKPTISFKPSKSGSNLTLSYEITYSSLGGKNNVTITSSSSPDLKETTIASKITQTSGKKDDITINPDTTYNNLYLTVTDALGESGTSQKVTIFGEERVFNVNKSGKGLAVGKISEVDECLESRYKILAHGGLYLKNSTTNYPAVMSATDDLWIGATGKSGTHNTKGGTYISAGAHANIYASKLVDGTRTNYTILDAENCYDYSDKIRIKMYANLSGSASNITFIDGIKASDFNFIEIYYKTNNDVGRKSTKAFLNKQTGLSVEISHCEPVSNENSIYIKTSLFVINDTTLTWKRGKYTKLSGTSAETIEYTENKILITGVYGYK